VRLAGENPVAAVMPGAMSAYRLWPADRYARTLRWLIDEGFYIVMLGGNDALSMTQHILAGMGPAHVLNLVGQTTLLETAAMFQQAAVCLSSDTGVLHVAYGTGARTVALFGPGRHRKWAPFGRHHITVRAGLPCSPCTRFGHTPACPHDIACMKAIPVEDVIGAIERVLKS